MTRTSKLPARHGLRVQRQPRAGSSAGAVPQVPSGWDWTMDPWMDSALRGTPPPAASRQAAQAQRTDPIQLQQDQGASERDDSATGCARTIHEAFHGSLLQEDEEAALAQIRGQSVASIRRIRSVYQARYGARLEEAFASYCDAAQAAEALALIWPALPIIDRLQRHTGALGDNEDGMMDVLRTATRSELAEAAADPRLQGLLDELSDDQQYQARKLIWPERKREHVLWRIERAHGTLSDDEDAVYSALLDLGPGERRALWDEREQRLSFLGESELALVRRMCVGADGGATTEAAALDVRMEIATEGLGTDDDAVRLVVGRAASLAEEEARLRTALDTGVTAEGAPLSADERAALQARRAALGCVREDLLTSERGDDGALVEQSFLGRLHDDVGAGEHGAFAEAMGADQYERMKQQLLDAAGVLDDDEQAMYRAFRDLRAPLTLPDGRAMADFSAAELRQMQEQATRALRQRLRSDPELVPVWSALDDDEHAVLDAHVAGDTYQIAIHELEDAYRGLDTDEARIVRIVARMSAEDRARMIAEQPPIYTTLTGGGLAAAEADLVTEVLRTGRVPTERALDVAMGGWGDGTDEQLLFDGLSAMPDEERRVHRLGYWLHQQGRAAEEVEGEARQQALERFCALHARLQAELDEEELDAAMERLIGLPSPEDMLSPQGRRMAAEIMAHRHRERLAMSAGLTEPFSSADETAAQAATIYDAHLEQLLRRGGDISLADFAVLVGLDAQFRGRFDEYRASAELVSNIAGTVAATVAAIVIVILSEGTLAPAAAELISSSGGAALWTAIAGAGTRVAASEAFGGDFHQTMSTEGARNALVGAIEGAVAVASAALAARAARLVGLSSRALGAEITRAAVDSAETGLALSGRGLARGSLEGVIDGFLSGAVGDLVMTATDAETWRRSVWETLGSLGMSLLRGGAFGAGGGAVVGGAMYGAGAFVRNLRGARRAEDALDTPRVSEQSDPAGRSQVDAERASEPGAPQHGSDVSTSGMGSQARAPGVLRDGRRRTPQEHAALEAELPPELRGIDIVESDAIEGAGVHVAYRDGALRIEVGPEAQPRHVRYHVGAARHLLKYQGPLGQLRKLLDAILTKLRLTPGYGTRGFEAREEVRKLIEIQAELETLRARLDGRIRALQGRDDLADLDPRQIERELAEIQEQLEYHQEFIHSYEPGRGFVAAASHGRALPELPVAKRDVYDLVSEESNRWKVEYRAMTDDGQDIWLGNGIVSLDDAGLPVEYPHFVLHATTLGPHERAVRIYDDVVEGVTSGERHSLTQHAIGTLEKRYVARFGHSPEALKGMLEWSNKLNFQTEFYRLTAIDGLSADMAAVGAIERISFGRHRIAAGYDDFSVTIRGSERVNLRDYGEQRVPKNISVIARRRQ